MRRTLKMFIEQLERIEGVISNEDSRDILDGLNKIEDQIKDHSRMVNIHNDAVIQYHKYIVDKGIDDTVIGSILKQLERENLAKNKKK